jgi:hypothetical protein
MSETKTRWAWFAVLALSLALHMVFLHRVPLSPDEVKSALASLDMVRNVDAVTTADSILLLLSNTLLFSVFGAGNGIARFIPALAGTVLVVLPVLWRDYLGREGSLTAAAVLLISPLLLFASRNVEGTILSFLAAAFMLTALSPALNKTLNVQQRNLFLVLGVSIGLLSGPVIYDLIFTAVAAWLFGSFLQKKKIDWVEIRSIGKPALLGLSIAVLASIGFGFRLSGWDGIMVGFANWLASWRTFSDTSHLGALLLYEPLTLMLSLLGFSYAWRKQDSFILTLTTWALLNLLIVSIRGGATVTGIGIILLPLALLSGYGLQNTILDIPVTKIKWVGMHVTLGFIFLLPGLIGLTQYGNGLISVEEPLLVLSGIAVLLALQILLAFLFSIVLPLKLLWRSAFLGMTVMGLFIQTGFNLQLNFVRPTSAVEPAVGSAGSPDIRAFERMVSNLAVQRGLRDDTVNIVIVDTNPDITNSVRWNLRHIKGIKFSPAWPSESALAGADIFVITSESVDTSTLSGQGWKGMRFIATHNYFAPIPICRRTDFIDCTYLVNWYLYRTSPYPQSPNSLILWVNQDSF